METPIPITISLTSDTYSSLLLQGLLCDYLSDTICPKHPHDGSPLAVPLPLTLTNTVVVRTVLLLQKNEQGTATLEKLEILIALAKCPVCKSRFRILPAARIMAELEIRIPDMAPLHSIPVLVNPTRYRSPERRERLEACRRFEKICAMVMACFCQFNRLIVGWGTSFGFCFRTGISSTLFEHIDSADMLACAKTMRKEAKECPIPGRSPPGDLK